MTDEAKSISTNKQGVSSISDPGEVQAACDGLITVNGKKLLVVRGGDATDTAGRIYIMAANKADRTGSKFKFSRSKRGLTEIDPIFENVVRVTPASMENYIKEWFTLGELLSTSMGKVIVIVDQLPRMATTLWGQGRFLGQCADHFEFVD
jgi:hypothetical protein